MSDVESEVDEMGGTRKVHHPPSWRTLDADRLIKAMNKAGGLSVLYGEPSSRIRQQANKRVVVSEDEIEQ